MLGRDYNEKYIKKSETFISTSTSEYKDENNKEFGKPYTYGANALYFLYKIWFENSIQAN